MFISYAMILIGYSSYAVIMIRSIADPPVDENDPETVEAFVKYLKREQYGDTPILKGRYYDDATAQISQDESFSLGDIPAIRDTCSFMLGTIAT